VRRPRFLRPPLPGRLGLRARITLAFAASAALLGALGAGGTWLITRGNLISQREAAATRQAYLNARYVRSQIPKNRDPATLQAVLGDLKNPQGSRPVLRLVDGTGEPVWVGEDDMPTSLKRLVEDGTAARMRYEMEGELELAIGIPLPDRQASYFEVISLAELERTLDSLAVSLLGASLVTTLAGAGLGWWVSRRTLRPLADVSVAAEAIAGGRLDTRLDGADDPDLNVLVSSFNHMAQALEERVERDGRFASDVSHELRSPLMTLAASVEVLAARRDEMPDASSQSAIDLMSADVARFRQLVDDLLEISRFDAGVARLSLDEVRVAELVRQAVAQTGHGDVPVEIDSEVAGMVIRADKRRIVRVVANLLDNASRYAGGATSVSVSRSEHGGVCLTVEDAGPGVPPEERDLVFERFSRGGSSAGRRGVGGEGVGLGLALVAEHVRLHGGQAWVTDRTDGAEGARFVVELPTSTA
jgi:signal transduction histidine kinase